MGRKDGRVQGTVEQAERDERKMKQMHDEYEKDRRYWQEIDHKKDELLDEMTKGFEE